MLASSADSYVIQRGRPTVNAASRRRAVFANIDFYLGYAQRILNNDM